LTLREIGERIGLTTAAVGDLATGRNYQPHGEAAVQLNTLHLLRCPAKAKSRRKAKNGG
jgi:hypothetical protein